jgi:hypothetical protein
LRAPHNLKRFQQPRQNAPKPVALHDGRFDSMPNWISSNSAVYTPQQLTCMPIMADLEREVQARPKIEIFLE